MIESCSIIGCGTLGSMLAVELAKSQRVSTLKLIDHDCVTGPSYPFQDYELHCPKVEVVRFLCLLQNEYMDVSIIQDKVVDNEFIDGYFVIDCRDRKDKNSKSNIRLSMDGDFLLIDSRKEFDVSTDHRYIMGRNVQHMQTAMKTIMKFIENHDYLYDDFQLIDLSEV